MSVKRIVNLLRYQEEIGNLPGNFDLRPNALCYNIVIHALARSGKRRAADRAEEIVRSMTRRYKEGGGDEEAYNVKPDMSNIYLVYAY